MRRNPFGFTETAADRYLREERERTKLFRDVLGGGAAAEAIRQATKEQELLRGTDFDAPYRGMLDTLARERESQKAFKHLASNAWALSVQETARTIAEQHGGLAQHQRHLASSALDTIKAFDINRGAVATAIAAATAGETYRRMVADALPRFSMFSAIAERMLMMDLGTLRASEDVVQSATELAARSVIEAQRIAEAFASAQTDEEGAVLYGSMLDVLAELFSNLGPNTIPELRRMGLVEFVSFIFGFLGLVLGAVALIPQDPSQSPQDKAAFAELTQKVDRLQQETKAYHEAEVHNDEAYVANLPRAELSRDATFRRTPERSGQVVLKAPKGAVLAIAENRGRWRLVVYRDPLSNQLARAWVYETAVTLLAPALGSGES